MVEISDGKKMLRGGFGANRLAIVWGEVARWGGCWRLKFRWSSLLMVLESRKRPRRFQSGSRLVERMTEAMMAMFSVNEGECLNAGRKREKFE